MMFLKKLWRGVPGNKFIVAMQDGVVKHLPFKDADSVRVPDELAATHDIYFAPSGFAGKNRVAKDAQGAAALWLDIDCGEKKPYKSQAEGATALAEWCAKRSMPAPSIVVSSGYGLHVYWLLEQPYAYDVWHRIANRIKQTALVDQFHIDPARTADIASVLRLPGTLNRKYGTEVECAVLTDTEARYTLHDFEKVLPVLGPTHVVRPTLPDDDEDKDYPEGNLEAVVAGCQQIRNSWGKSDTPEPLWRAALSVLSRCQAGEQASHAYSKGDPRYTHAETQSKIDRTAGPLSCEQFESACPGGCAGCPNQGTVRSPIQLRNGTPVPQPRPQIKPENPWPWAEVGKYKLTWQGIHLPSEDGEPAEVVSRNPIWVSAFRSAMRAADEKPHSEAELTYITSDGRKDKTTIDAGVMADKKAFEQQIRHAGLTGVFNYPKLNTFLSAYMDKHVETIGTESGIRRLGWCDTGFILGNRMVTAQGVRPAKVISSSPVFKQFVPQGTLEGWKQAIASINRDEYLALQATVLCGFGSVLLELANVQSASLILSGESGGGKTSAAKAAISIYGPTQPLTQDATTSTNKGLAVTFSMARNIPVLVDEIGPILAANKVQRFGDLIYLAANGAGGASMTRDRSLRDMGTWALQPIMTSNLQVLDLSQRELMGAQRNRIIELPVLKAMDRVVGARFAEADKNCGQACVPYLQQVCALREQIKDMVEQAAKDIIAKYNLPSAARFCSWTLAAAAVGGAIAKALGLIPYDINNVIAYVAEASGAQVTKIIASSDLVSEMLPEWLRENATGVLDLRNGMSLEMAQPSRIPLAVLYKDEAIISAVALGKALRDSHIPSAAFMQWLEATGGSKGRAQLSANTPSVAVYKLPYGSINFGDEK